MPLYLREWRKTAGLTLEQVANSLGLHLSAVQKWEKGVNGVDTANLLRLANLYGVHPAALFFHPEDRNAAERLTRAHGVLGRLDGEKADAWLALGETFAPPAEKQPQTK